MDTVIFYSSLIGLILAMAVGWILTLFGLPGNWLMVGMAALFAWLNPTDGSFHISWLTVGSSSVLAGLGEIAEFAASIWGAKKAGGSRRAAWMALAGSLIGAVSGGILGIPIPVIGSAVAAVLGGALGALLGAAFGEYSQGETHDKSLRVGAAAFLGRLLGTGAKSLVATVIVVLLLVALFV